jgi:AbrB family looped-hinge helix DNA binding protein
LGGFIAKVINGGRITIPKDVREKLEIKDGTYVHVHILKLDLFRMSMHRFYAPERAESMTKKQVSATKFK